MKVIVTDETSTTNLPIYRMSKTSSPPAKVDRTMIVRDIITLFPEAVDVMTAYGIHCFSCALGGVETLEEGCRIHGFEDEVTNQLIEDINQAIADAPARPEIITITESAASAIGDIASSQGHEGEGLNVIVDENGGFCMEFSKEKTEGDSEFFHEKHPDIKVWVSAVTLRRIGGATIDVRDGRFKLDLPEDSEQSGCGCSDRPEGGCCKTRESEES